MKLILVCGPWSSGTTSVAGMLDALGMDGRGPFFRTNDLRTQNCFESLAFRAVVESILSENTLKPKVSAKAARLALSEFRDQLLLDKATADATDDRPVFLKYPLASMLIPLISEVFDTRLIYVLRPLREIEATRVRRKWEPHAGEAGARIIYGRMFDCLLNLARPTLIVRYPELLGAPLAHARLLAGFAGIGKLPEDRLQAAAAFIRTAKA